MAKIGIIIYWLLLIRSWERMGIHSSPLNIIFYPLLYTLFDPKITKTDIIFVLRFSESIWRHEWGPICFWFYIYKIIFLLFKWVWRPGKETSRRGYWKMTVSNGFLGRLGNITDGHGKKICSMHNSWSGITKKSWTRGASGKSFFSLKWLRKWTMAEIIYVADRTTKKWCWNSVVFKTS